MGRGEGKEGRKGMFHVSFVLVAEAVPHHLGNHCDTLSQTTCWVMNCLSLSYKLTRENGGRAEGGWGEGGGGGGGRGERRCSMCLLLLQQMLYHTTMVITVTFSHRPRAGF